MHRVGEVGQSGARKKESDGCNDQTKFSGFSLSISAKDEADADRIFNALSSGGQVTMPLTKTFWSPRFGMLTDKFGVSWMVIVPGEMQK